MAFFRSQQTALKRLNSGCQRTAPMKNRQAAVCPTSTRTITLRHGAQEGALADTIAANQTIPAERIDILDYISRNVSDCLVWFFFLKMVQSW